jgi:octaprenyl-diphosphate synthase
MSAICPQIRRPIETEATGASERSGAASPTTLKAPYMASRIAGDTVATSAISIGTPKSIETIARPARSADRQAAWRQMAPLYAPIADEMEQIEEILKRELRSDYPFVDELVQYGCLLGGKRLRPALLLLTAKALGEIRREHLVLAAVVEMIHTATLVHDDVLDEAQMRRRLATVNSRWDNKSSVLLGDYLFTHAFYLSSTLDSTFACRQIGKATNVVCEGELRQIGGRADYTLGEAEYIGILDAKTAELCACCCLLGAHYSGADEATCLKLANFGRDLGIGFQIADDLLDITGDEQTTGKSLGTDLVQQKPTLPLIRALAVAEPSERQKWLALLDDPSNLDREELLDWLRRSGAIDYARAKARWYADRASAVAAALAPSAAREVLAMLPEFAVMRAE